MGYVWNDRIRCDNVSGITELYSGCKLLEQNELWVERELAQGLLIQRRQAILLRVSQNATQRDRRRKE